MTALPRFALEATIPEGEATSAALPINGTTLVGVFVPAAWTAASLGFSVSLSEAGPFADMLDADGAEVAIASPVAGSYVALPAGALHGIGWMRVRSGATGDPVDQEAERTVVLVTRPFM